MPLRALVLALENYISAARLPKALRDGGFEVAVICYPSALVALTKHVDRKELIQPSDDAARVASVMVSLIENWGPRLVIPADDRALRFLHHVVEVERFGRLPRVLIDLVKASLPEPSAFCLASDKRAASDFMAELGFPGPEWRPIVSVAEARDFAAAYGFPVLLKPAEGRAGQGVQICMGETDLASATLTDGDWVAQRYIAGVAAESSGIAWKGRLLGCILYERFITDPPEIGPTCVAKIIDHDTMAAGLAAFAKATRHNGFLSLGWILEESTRNANFLEVNARSVPIIGPSPKLGLNLCECLWAKLTGSPRPKLDPNAPRLIALYPQELYRDPNSAYREHVLDEPFDDPEVHQAMQKGIELIASGLA